MTDLPARLPAQQGQNLKRSMDNHNKKQKHKLIEMKTNLLKNMKTSGKTFLVQKKTNRHSCSTKKGRTWILNSTQPFGRNRTREVMHSSRKVQSSRETQVTDEISKSTQCKLCKTLYVQQKPNNCLFYLKMTGLRKHIPPPNPQPNNPTMKPI